MATVNEIIKLSKVHYPMGDESTLHSASDVYPEAIRYISGEDALYNKINSLSPKQLAELYALMLIGHKDSKKIADDWNRFYHMARASQHFETVSYITDRAISTQYLEYGLAKLDSKNKMHAYSLQTN